MCEQFYFVTRQDVVQPSLHDAINGRVYTDEWAAMEAAFKRCCRGQQVHVCEALALDFPYPRFLVRT